MTVSICTAVLMADERITTARSFLRARKKERERGDAPVEIQKGKGNSLKLLRIMLPIREMKHNISP